MTSLRQTRIDNMIAECGLPDNETIRNAVGKLLDWQPNARELQYEGRCDICKRDGYLSYILPDHTGGYEIGREWCGYYCARCDFGNAGSREAL